MYSKEEAKKVRKQFWIFFAKRYPRKWLLYNTGLKDVTLKFDFTNGYALVAIDSESNDEIDKAYYYEKLLSLKSLLLEEVSPNLIFNDEYLLNSGKVISRVYIRLEGVKINNKNDWPKVFDFLYEYMSKLELFYLEYQDFIKD
ncbi:DUF4268 domain-containing protein [Dokdonia sp. LLG6352-1]|uniref:DUF4268 domain-containing protein n=1 Tax=Dokdonia sp. LLG6352-1 TaxID=3160831 RepID=UPI00386D4E5D